MLRPEEVSKLLIPFGIVLSAYQLGQLMTYLELLLRWNDKMNLTAIRTPDECVTRHFGESLYLAKWIKLTGANLDIGSGAGFPGLALKIAFPALRTTLLEPVARKRAFLKEVARSCQMRDVEVRPERLEGFADLLGGPRQGREVRGGGMLFDSATARAVGRVGELTGLALRCLAPGGRLCLWLSREQSEALAQQAESVLWEARLPVPLSSQREIAIGVPSVDQSFGSAARQEESGRQE